MELSEVALGEGVREPVCEVVGASSTTVPDWDAIREVPSSPLFLVAAAAAAASSDSGDGGISVRRAMGQITLESDLLIFTLPTVKCP